MKTIYSLHSYRFTLIFFLLSTFLVNAQEDSEILEAYEEYTDAAREVVYMHLNKSTYITGESIGFTAYVMDKKDKKPSLLTTNLYVSIEDKNKNVLKKKLIKVTDGVASNTFEVDSLFNSGYYNIKAYTNWMLNFNEQNFYTESIRIINPDNEEFVEETLVDNTIDAQFLPESGHLLNGVINNIGVVIKDNLGFGMPNATGEIVDKNNEVLSSFETNQFGIGKFQLLADVNNTYKVNIENANKDFSFDLNQNIEEKGIIMSLKSLKSKVFVSLITNAETLENIKNRRHTLMIHNGENYDIMDIYFTDETVVTKAIDYTNSASGVNILTLFNENDQPIAERLFFNYEGINVLASNDISATRSKDLVTVKLNFKAIDPAINNSLSVSVLPQETESYNKHNNIVSYTFLQPYINGTIEQAKYYFTDINPKKQYELDNLLLTQGWSSYDWNQIFNDEYNQTYNFEQGIRLKANLSSNAAKGPQNNFLMHAISDEEPRVFELKEGDDSFVVENLFPVGQDQISMSKMTQINGLIPASLYFQSFPNSIPRLTTNFNVLKPKLDYKISESLTRGNKILENNIDDVQRLDEVVVKSRRDRKRQRIEKLSQGKYGKISVVDEEDRLLFNTLKWFLLSKGFNVDESNGGFIVTDRHSLIGRKPEFGNSEISNPDIIVEDPTSSSTEGASNGPSIYLDDMQLLDTSLLSGYSLTNIDYIEINRLGIGEGMRGNSGSIRIYSNPAISGSYNNQDSVQQFKLPLVFSAEKKYYAPKYRNTGDSFYKAYGAIEWKPKLTVDENGTISIKFTKPRIPVTLYIEGIANDGSFIFEEKTISLNKNF